MAQPHAVVISGSGRYADPWHPFAETSGRIAALLRETGFDAEVDEDADARLADLSGVDLAVVNLGHPDHPSEADEAGRVGLLAYLAAGKPLLVSHVSSTSLPAVPEWEAIVGGLWVFGTTFHPDYGPSHVEVVDQRHPISAGIGAFELVDERYTALRVSPEVHVLAQHELEGIAHPLLWTHRYGGSLVVYDALGHDAASFESAEHCELIRRAATWLIAE